MDFHQIIDLLCFYSRPDSLPFCSNKLLQVPRSQLKCYGDRRFPIASNRIVYQLLKELPIPWVI